MQSSFRLLAVTLLIFAVWVPRASAQDEDQTYIITTYHVAPGHQTAFLEWAANQDAIAQEVGLPIGQWYVHMNGDSWDYLQIAPDIDTTPEQDEALDAAARARGMATGPAVGIELRQHIASHTDTFVAGPMTAAEILAALRGD